MILKEMSIKRKTIILIHGLWDNPRVFDRLIKKLRFYDVQILTPHMRHGFGKIDINDLAIALDDYISTKVPENVTLDLVGFSMGGLIARVWLQKMGGTSRTNRFISIGSPHKGTILAQVMPTSLMKGIGQMKRGSSFLVELNSNYSVLENVECISFFCRLDLMVVPGWDATLPLGVNFSIPVSSHKALIKSNKGIDCLVNTLVKGKPPVQNV